MKNFQFKIFDSFIIFLGILFIYFFNPQVGKAQQPIEASMADIIKSIKKSTIPIESTTAIEDEGPKLKIPDLKFKDLSTTITKPLRMAITDEVTALSPSPTDNFQAIKLTGITTGTTTRFSFPPDVAGAVGPVNVIAMHNTHILIQGKNGQNCCIVGAGATNYPFIPLGDFWKPLNGWVTYPNVFDPKVVYVPSVNRFVAVTLSGKDLTSSKLLLAISNTSDASGSWRYYQFDSDDTHNYWADFPSIGFNKDWIIVTANMYNGSNTLMKINAYVFTANQMYNSPFSNTPRRISKDYGISANTLLSNPTPCYTYDNTLDKIYLVSSLQFTAGNTNSYIKIYELNGPVGSETISNGTLLGSPANYLFYGDPVALTQSQSNKTLYDCTNPPNSLITKIDTRDSRILSAVFRNGKIWASHNAKIGSSSTSLTKVAAQWYQLNTSPSISYSTYGRIEDLSTTNTKSYLFPSISVNANNDAFISFSTVSSNTFVSSAYAVKKSTDAQFRDPYIYKNGVANYAMPQYSSGVKTSITNTEGARLGDYMSACVDPSNDLDFWALSQYTETSDCTFPTIPDRWATQWAKVTSTSFFRYAAVTETESILNVLKSINVSPNPTSNTLKLNGINDLHTIQYQLTGLEGTKLLEGSIHDSEEINLSHLNNGMYFLRLEKNNIRYTTKVIKQ